MSSTEGILKQAISQLIQQIPDIEDLNHLLGESLNIISFSENEEILKGSLSNLIEKISNTGGLNHLISVMTNIIEFRKNKKTKVVEPQPDVENLEDFPKLQEKKQSYKEAAGKGIPSSPSSSNSVMSTNSSHNNEQSDDTKYITGITKGNQNNYIITNINDFIYSMINIKIPMWKIMYYLYISNKEFDNSGSTSTEDANNNQIAYEILDAHSSNKLIKFDENHEYYSFIVYYFNKIIKCENKEYSIKIKNKEGNSIRLFFRTRFLIQINKLFKK